MARTPRWLGLISLSLFVAAVGCGGSEPPPEPPPTPPQPLPAVTASATAAPVDTTPSEPIPPPLPAVDFVAGTPDAPPDKAPVIAIKAPAKDQVIAIDKAADFQVKLDLKGWDAPAGGKHVHLILDGHPYKRIDDPKQPIKLHDIDPNYELKEGQHVLVAFPSRHTHESVKPIAKAVPLAVVSFFIGKKGEVKWKPADPTFIFSRPKGANNGPPPADGILVDWYLSNADLGDGKSSIEATLTGPGLEDGKKVTIKSWTPWRITNARTGTYSLHMSLLDKDGKPVPGPMNDVTREFQVDTSAPPDAHPMGPAPTPAPAASPTPPSAKK